MIPYLLLGVAVVPIAEPVVDCTAGAEVSADSHWEVRTHIAAAEVVFADNHCGTEVAVVERRNRRR